LIESGTMPHQRTVSGTLAELPARALERGFAPPALLVVGEVVSRRQALEWFESRPLFGQRIVVTRPAAELERSALTLEDLGAEVLMAPTVTIGPIPDATALDRAIDGLDSFDWLAFTSGNGVRYFLDRLESRGLDLRALGHLKLAAIGPSTAQALAHVHLRADLMPEEYRSESLAAALRDYAPGKRILLARADRGRTVLEEELARVARVERVAVYRNADAEALPAAVLERISDGTVDWITITSSAIVERLYTLMPESARDRVGSAIRLASLSPVTTASAQRLGWPVAVEARAYTWHGLIEALASTVSSERDALRQGD
jgi:uroporphyrinogen III methyltransferase/synthase